MTDKDKERLLRFMGSIKAFKYFYVDDCVNFTLLAATCLREDKSEMTQQE